MPNVPTLSTIAIISTARGRCGLDGGVGQPAVERPQRCLDGEREHEAEEQRVEDRRVDGRARRWTRRRRSRGSRRCRRRTRRCWAVTTYRPMTAASMISPPNRLYSRNFTAALDRSCAAEPADEEVHRDQHGLEEHVEQQDVQRDQRDQHHALDGQRQRHVGVRRAAAQAGLVVGVVPARDDQQRHQHRGQHHERQGDAVDAEDVAGAERRYPRLVLDELVLRARAGRTRRRATTASASTDQRDRQRDPLGERTAATRATA